MTFNMSITSASQHNHVPRWRVRHSPGTVPVFCPPPVFRHRNCPRAAVINLSMLKDVQQTKFTKYDALQYISAANKAAESIDQCEADVHAITAGRINSVYIVTGSLGKAVVKKAAPYVRSIGPEFPLDVGRIEVEAGVLRLLQPLCGKHLPRVLHFDAGEHVMVQQYIGPPHQQLLSSIAQMQHLTGVGRQLAELLATYLFHTSHLASTPGTLELQRQRFMNAEIRRTNEHVVLTDAFGPSPANKWTSPQLDTLVTQLKSNPDILAAVQQLAELYRTRHDALIHNDLHAANLLVAPGSLYLVDWEFATYGPMSFDLGSLTASLLLAYFALDGLSPAATIATSSVDCSDLLRWGPGQQQEWLLQVVVELWQCFPADFCRQWSQARAASTQQAASCDIQKDHPLLLCQEQQQLMVQMWQESLGFAGCCMSRLIMGMHHHPLLEAISDPFDRAACEAGCLHVASQLLLRREELTGVEDLVALVRSCHRGSAAATAARGELGW